MGDSNAVCVLSLVRGHALAYQENAKPSGAAIEYKGDRDKEQKWVIETGDDANTIAIRSIATGTYLRAEQSKYAEVVTGDKQWWKIVPITDDCAIKPLGSCRLQAVGAPELFLHNSNESGSCIKPGGNRKNSVYITTYLESNHDRFLWYFVDPVTSANRTPGQAGSDSLANDTSEADAEKAKALEDREAALAQREQDVSNEKKELEDREASLAQRKEDISSEKNKLQDREAYLAQKEEDTSSQKKKLEEREAALAQRDEDISNGKRKLEEREASFAQKEEDIAAGKKKLEEREVSFAQKDKDHSAEKKALDDQKAALEQKEKDYSTNMIDLEDRKATLDQQEKDSAAGKKTFDDRNTTLTKKQKEVSVDRKALEDREAALAKKEKERFAEWNKKMEELKGLQSSSAQLKKSNAVGSGCGYKHYKPPRKLEKKVIGLVYEK